MRPEDAENLRVGDDSPRPVGDHHSLNPSKDAKTKILLIDLENCPNQIQHLQENLEQFSQVVICYAQSGAKIPLDWLIPLAMMVNANKLKIFKMTNGGKNAADFGISLFAGSLMHQLEQDTHFVIVSNDQDLDHVVDLLKSQGRSAERVGTHKPEKQAKQDKQTVKAELTISESLLQTYCQYLIASTKNRPAKRDSLLNSIKSRLKIDLQTGIEVVNLLIVQDALKISDTKVSYNDKKIKELAGSS
jgi:hypothetical protein